MLEELETCKAPSSDALETFLVNALVISEFVGREKQTSLVGPQKLGKIVNNNFDQTLCLEWAKRLLKLKEDCKNSFVSSDVCQNFEEAWQTKYSDKTLSEFCAWCKALTPERGARSENISPPVTLT